MSGILLAAVAGGVGGAIGGGAAWALGKVLGRQPRWLAFLPVVFAVFAASLSRTLQSPTGGAMAELDKIAPFQAIKTHYPKDYERLEAGVRQARSVKEAARRLTGFWSRSSFARGPGPMLPRRLGSIG